MWRCRWSAAPGLLRALCVRCAAVAAAPQPAPQTHEASFSSGWWFCWDPEGPDEGHIVHTWLPIMMYS